MEYTKESLKGWGKSIAGLGGDMDGHLLNYASAWAQEVAELRELCRLKDREGASFIDDDPLPDSDYDRMGELWAKHITKHMKGGEG